ncbi:MAG: hypothetical protein Kow0065_18610 [Methylomicrobium sp.]
MPNPHSLQHSRHDLMPHWLVLTSTLITIAAFVVFCHLADPQWRFEISEEQRILVRTIFYVLAIVGFPLTNLLRHILLRLNQTMPGDKPAKARYLMTVIVSMTFAECVGVMGLVMFLLGDDFNTLYIFTLLAVLSVYLYRPKASEYRTVLEELASRRQTPNPVIRS